MGDRSHLSRRKFLLKAGLLGCSAAASPLITPMSFAAAPWEARLVVIILRGGMDGLDVVQPYGDPALAGLRRSLGFGQAAGATDLDGFFALHPGLAGLMPLWQAGELGFAHAVSTPYRDKRSHFDGQDLLEAGTGDATTTSRRDGWLNRLLATVPGAARQTGFSIGREDLMILNGSAPVSSWSPDARLDLSPQSKRLLELVYHEDPLFRAAITEAIALAEDLDPGADVASYEEAMTMMQQNMTAANRGKGHVKIAKFAAERLREDTRIASFSINGWDTHSNQAGALSRGLGKLQDTILTLRDDLGPVWQKTCVLAMTEFGRTARENGSGGTDHGTGGAMVMAGGAVRGGQVYSDWPGLAEPDLYQGRDLRPTMDVRAYAAGAMQGLFGLETSILEGAVFPGLGSFLPRVIL